MIHVVITNDSNLKIIADGDCVLQTKAPVDIHFTDNRVAEEVAADIMIPVSVAQWVSKHARYNGMQAGEVADISFSVTVLKEEV